MTITAKDGVISGKYKNVAKFKKEGATSTTDSKDFIEISQTAKVKIDKYVIEAASEAGSKDFVIDDDDGGPSRTVPVTQAAFNNSLGDSRANKTDPVKEGDPVNLGYNISTKTVKYKIVVKNEGTSTVTGTLSDVCEISGSFSSRNVTLGAGETKEFEFTGHLYSGWTAGKYKNTAYFTVGSQQWKSSDWVKIEEPDPEFIPSATLTKEVIKVSTPGDSTAAVNRTYSGRYNKDYDPAEVVQGSEVTFRITVTNYTWYKNSSDKDHNDSKDWRINNCYADLGFSDHYDTSEFDFVSINIVSGYGTYSGGSGDYTFNFYNIPQYSSAIVDITLKVKVDNMHLPNLYNEARGVDISCQSKYYYFSHTVYVHHWEEVEYPTYGYNSKGELVQTGTYKVNEPRYECPYSCAFIELPKKNFSATVDCYDYDCVRVLDPIVSGIVFFDANKNGYKDGTDENINKMNNGETDPQYYLDYTDYQDITVELWDASTNAKVAGPLPININGSTGEFSFGRVRKGTSYSGSQSTSGYEQWEIGEYNHFKYTGSGRYNYYVVFNYNGVKYEATTDSQDTNINHADSHRIKNEMAPDGTSRKFTVDSNASEINRPGFNQKFETIANDKAFPNTTGAGSYIPLEYTEKGENLQKSFLTGHDPGLLIQAKSFRIFYESGDIEYLRYINLGIKLRPQGDMSATKDVVQAEVTINGYKTIYTYEQLGNGGYTVTSSNTLSTPYKLRIYREDYEFRTNKYAANIQTIKNTNNPYTSFDRTNDLEIILTYKITAKNDSGNADAYVREFIDYSLKDEVEFREARLDKMDGDLLTGSSTSNYQNVSYADSSIYETTYITGDGLNRRLRLNETISIFVTYKVKKDGSGYIIKDSLGGRGKENTGEIGAFSLYVPGTSTPAGMIDGDSNPGNAKPNDPDHFEDDTFKTTILILLRDEDGEHDRAKQDYRNISGVVFEEIKKEVLSNSDGQLVGDSKMDLERDDTTEEYKVPASLDKLEDLDDIPANNVLVKLYEVVQDGGKEYYIDTGMWYRTWVDTPEKHDDGSPITATERAEAAKNPQNGRYYFGDGVGSETSVNGESTDDKNKLHPGIYTIRFIYGDDKDYLVTTDGNLIRYSGQDYQSTKYTEILDTPNIAAEEIVGTASDNELKAVKATVFDLRAYDGDKDEAAADPFFKTITYTDSKGITHTENVTTLGKNIYSLAKDNEIRRLESNSYSTTTTYITDTVLKVNNSLGLVDPSLTGEDKTEAEEKLKIPDEQEPISDIVQETGILAEHTSMYGDSKFFEMDLEYYGNFPEPDVTVTVGGVEKKARENYIISGILTVDKYYYSVRSINFGLTERAKTKLQLMNDIIGIKAITSDGRELVDLVFDVLYESKGVEHGAIKEIKHKSVINYEKSKGHEEVQVLNRNGLNQGFRYINVDSDLLQGMVLQVTYRISIANISEVDHISKELQDAMMMTVEELQRTGSSAKPTLTELEVVYDEPIDTSTSPLITSTGSTITDTINIKREIDGTDTLRSQSVEHNYENNYLYSLVNTLKTSAEYETTYDGGSSVGPSSMRKTYTYSNIKALNSSYTIGYYVGNTYYTAITDLSKEARVQTRVDQFINYVDNDLIFKPEENLLDIREKDMEAGVEVLGGINKNEGKSNQLEYLTYTTKEISAKGLLKDVVYDVKYKDDGTVEKEFNPVKSITDGEKDYYNEDKPNTNNNLAFNIEKEGVIIANYKNQKINLGTYKFLQPIVESEAFKEIPDIEKTIPGNPNLLDSSGKPYFDYDNEGVNRNIYNNKTIYSLGNPYYNRKLAASVDDEGLHYNPATLVGGYYNYNREDSGSIPVEQEYDYYREINKWLYVTELKASKVLTSELDIEGLIIDNLAEIVKSTNTVGRKVYVLSSNETAASATVDNEYKTGYLGNTTKEPVETVNIPSTDSRKKTLVEVSLRDTDTDFTEFITLSPPTGLLPAEVIRLEQINSVQDALLIVIPLIIIILGSGYVIVQFAKRKKFYK